MHAVNQFNINYMPNMGGNPATRLMANPAAHVNTERLPSWVDLRDHILALKSNIFTLCHNVKSTYDFLDEHGMGQGEANVLTTRFLSDAEVMLDNLNGIALRHGLDGGGYLGVARNPEEGRDIVLSSTEATEIYSRFTTECMLTTQRLSEMSSLIQLHLQRQLRNEELAEQNILLNPVAAAIAPSAQVPQYPF